jgi:hypothetical protein
LPNKPASGEQPPRIRRPHQLPQEFPQGEQHELPQLPQSPQPLSQQLPQLPPPQPPPQLPQPWKLPQLSQGLQQVGGLIHQSSRARSPQPAQQYGCHPQQPTLLMPTTASIKANHPRFIAGVLSRNETRPLRKPYRRRTVGRIEKSVTIGKFCGQQRRRR